MPNPETADGGYEGAGIYGHGIGPGTIYYDIHRFLYIIYVKVRNPGMLRSELLKISSKSSYQTKSSSSLTENSPARDIYSQITTSPSEQTFPPSKLF